MNINIKTNYDTAEAMNIRLFADKIKNREVDTDKAENGSIADKTIKFEKDKIKEKVQQAAMMDASEVKNFLFMLIGAEVKIKPDNDNSGAMIDRLA